AAGSAEACDGGAKFVDGLTHGHELARASRLAQGKTRVAAWRRSASKQASLPSHLSAAMRPLSVFFSLLFLAMTASADTASQAAPASNPPPAGVETLVLGGGCF